MSEQRHYVGTSWLPSWRRKALAGTIFVILTLFAPSASRGWDKYGAIAYSSSARAWGYSYDWDSRGQAESKALLECSAKGEGCEVLTWFKNNCGALATASDGSYGYAWADSKWAAINEAIGYCREHGGTDCEWKCWACNSR